MKHYQCPTNDTSKAVAVYVPYYPSLDVSRYLWDEANASRKDTNSLDLFRFLRTRPQWGVMGGKDHFLVSGRITWNFRRVGHNVSHWGSTVMVLPESENMTMITIESSPWDRNDFASLTRLISPLERFSSVRVAGQDEETDEEDSVLLRGRTTPLHGGVHQGPNHGAVRGGEEELQFDGVQGL